jgi:hypothetical protein
MPQLSDALTRFRKSGSAIWQFVLFDAVMMRVEVGAQLVTTGASVSATVTLASQVELLPNASVAVIVTVCTPIVTADPASGD